MSLHIEYADASYVTVGLHNELTLAELHPIENPQDRMILTIFAGDHAEFITGTPEELSELATRIYAVVNADRERSL